MATIKKALCLKAWGDESGFLMAPLVQRSWTSAGEPPVLCQQGAHHREISAIAALYVSSEPHPRGTMPQPHPSNIRQMRFIRSYSIS